jgi:hypothetical protein
MNNPKVEYIFMIDTNKYAGNFEREMCAYSTGIVGDCGVGEENANQFVEDLGEETVFLFQDYVDSRPDDHGCCRPVKIQPNPGIYPNENESYSTVGIFFYEKPTDEIIQIMKERSKIFAEQEAYNIKILGYRLVEKKTTYTEIKVE